MHSDLLGKLMQAQPSTPKLPDQLINLGLNAPSARGLGVMHPSPPPDLVRIENHGIHHTLTIDPRACRKDLLTNLLSLMNRQLVVFLTEKWERKNRFLAISSGKGWLDGWRMIAGDDT